MTLAIAIGTHNLSAVPIILAVVVIGAAVYFFWRRSRNQRSGHDR
jgi:preprotein translocase subunit YajC